MTQKIPSVSSTGNGKQFPPDAYAYNDDVSLTVVNAIRADKGVDVSSPRWKTIEAMGQVVRP